MCKSVQPNGKGDKEKMNKAVMISIQPKWCKLIANGKKTIEVRKTKPKLQPPFKVYIYATKSYNNKNTLLVNAGGKNVSIWYAGNGTVIGEFVCDYIDELHEYELIPQGNSYLYEKARLDLFFEQSCLSYGMLSEYRKNLPYYRPLYGWHISNLVIYDEPKELREFGLTRPFQSWGYVEERK